MAPETNATDWSTSYSQYLARSAALSARTLGLYQLALERVSQGKLPTTVFQDHFPGFAIAHAREFTNRYAEVASRFLSDLVRLSSRLSQHAADGTQLEEQVIPPQFDIANPARWYEQIAEYAGRLNARAVKAYRSQLDRIAAGEITPSEVQQNTAEQMTQQLPGYIQGMTQLYFDLLNGLNDVRSAYEEAYFGGLLATARAEDTDSPVTLTLAGPTGTTAAASLSITNLTGQRTQIRHRIVDVRRVDGVGPSLTPAITLVPETLELDPNEEGTLTVSLLLDPQQFDSDALYSGELLFTGASDVPLQVDVRILLTSRGPQPANGQH